MPEFIPLAGFSPSCWVVFVQMEHCAIVDEVVIKKEKRNAMISFFTIYSAKLTGTGDTSVLNQFSK